jgi:acetyl esterase/lipase
MPLDSHAKRFLDMLAVGGALQAAELTPATMREELLRLSRIMDVKNVPIAQIENRRLHSDGEIPIRVYVPAETTAKALPGLVYFHGGMGVFCSIETHEGLCRMLANASGCRVISVEYRLAPEHKFPAAVEDSFAAAKWTYEHALELGIDPERLAVGGDSAGGTLAAVVCQLAKQATKPRIALQVLLSPVTDLGAETLSRRTYAEGYFLDNATMEWALRHYCSPEADLSDPRLSPFRARDLRGLPPAHIHTAEFDPLRDEGKAYADRLVQAGVDVRYTCHPGMIHHFYGMAAIIPYAGTAIRAAGAAIREALA